MKIVKIETLHCDGGWRPWSFVKIETNTGLTGYSEVTDSHGSPLAIARVVQDLEKILIGQDPRSYEKLYWSMYMATRQSPGGIVQKAIAGIENALLDIKAKALGIPVYELFGGPLRDQIKVYWSHCGTTRVRSWDKINKPPLQTLEAISKLGREVREMGFSAFKTNIIIPGNPFRVYMPGFGVEYDGVAQNIDRQTMHALKTVISTFRDSVGSDVDIILDLNFNFKTEGYIQIARELEEFNILWLEIDSYDPEALLQIKKSTRIPICSGENLYSTRDFRPYFERHAMGIASIDVIWNGFSQAKKISDLAELYEMNITPHNHYSHLATFISAHFCASVPNFQILEVDIDDVPWKDELVTRVPEIYKGHMHLPKQPGWGVELNEKVLLKHPWTF